MIRTLFSAVLYLAVSCLSAQSIKKVYFIGNSYTAFNDLAGITQYIGQAHGDSFEVVSRAPGGMTFNGHSSAPDLYMELRNGMFDAVILQEQSQIPSFPLSQVQNSCFPYAKKLVDSIRAINPKSKIVFFTTWGRENGDAQNCPTWEPVCTFLGMNELLRERYQIMAKDNQCKAAPVASVWRDLRAKTSLQLYEADGSHPSPKGSIVAAATIYATLFSKMLDPEIALPALTDNEKSQIISTTNAMIKDSLSFYDFEQKPGVGISKKIKQNIPNSLCITHENSEVHIPSAWNSAMNHETWMLVNTTGQITTHLFALNSKISIPINQLTAGIYTLTNGKEFHQKIMVIK